MIHRNRYLPYPELVDSRPGSRYRIRDSEGRHTTGSVDKLHRRMWVPLKAAGRPVARHELAHVRWSPLELPAVRYPIVFLHAVEDARINLGLARRGLPVELEPADRTHVQWLALRDLEEGRASDFVLRWVASAGTNAEPLLDQAARGAGEAGAFAARCFEAAIATLERRRGQSEVAPFEAARDAARQLARRLRSRGLLDPAFRRITVELPCCGIGPEARPGGGGDDEGDGPPAPGGAGGGSDGLGSGHLEVVEAPLTRVHAAAQRLRPVWRAAVEGSRPGALHRWALDKAVFKRRTRRAGGSVLIDCSGSMSLGEGEIDGILRASGGGALVAVYSGRRDRGQLRIVARGGRRAEREHLHRFGGGNVVDAPALEWLSRQPAPRLWVSDGGVSGIDDRPSKALRKRCAELCRRGRIRRYEDAEAATRALAKGAV